MSLLDVHIVVPLRSKMNQSGVLQLFTHVGVQLWLFELDASCRWKNQRIEVGKIRIHDAKKITLGKFIVMTF